MPAPAAGNIKHKAAGRGLQPIQIECARTQRPFESDPVRRRMRVVEKAGGSEKPFLGDFPFVSPLRKVCMRLPAVLPPPEEEKDVKTAIGAARAKKARREML